MDNFGVFGVFFFTFSSFFGGEKTFLGPSPPFFPFSLVSSGKKKKKKVKGGEERTKGK